MGGISVGGGGHGKKSVDAEIPLVPFIDLLLCCVMFLLVTAVWNRLARLDTNQEVPGQQAANPTEQQEPPNRLFLQITAAGYTIVSTLGDRVEIPKNGSEYDNETLSTRLQERHNAEPNRRDIIVASEDGVRYEDIITAMDLAMGARFTDVSLSDRVSL